MIRYTLVCLAIGAIVLLYLALGTDWAIPLALIAVAAGLVLVMEKLA